MNAWQGRAIIPIHLSQKSYDESSAYIAQLEKALEVTLFVRHKQAHELGNVIYSPSQNKILENAANKTKEYFFDPADEGDFGGGTRYRGKDD